MALGRGVLVGEMVTVGKGVLVCVGRAVGELLGWGVSGTAGLLVGEGALHAANKTTALKMTNEVIANREGLMDFLPDTLSLFTAVCGEKQGQEQAQDHGITAQARQSGSARCGWGG